MRIQLAFVLALAPVALGAAGPFGPSASAPADYVIEKTDQYSVVLLGEAHWIRHDALLVAEIVPRLAERRVVLGMETLRAGEQAALDRLLSEPEWDDAAAMRLMRLAAWPYRDYLDILRAAWKANRATAGSMRVLALAPDPDWRERGVSVDAFMADLVAGEVAAGRHVLVYCGLHHAFTRYHQPELDLEGRARAFFDRTGNILRRRFGERVFLITLHRPVWCGKEPWDYCLPLAGAIDCAAAETGRAVGFDISGSELAPQVVDRSVYYAHGYADLRFGEMSDGYVWTNPIEQYELVGLIPLSEFAPDDAALREVAANNPFSDEKKLQQERLEILWAEEGKARADVLTYRRWEHLAAWREACGPDLQTAGAIDLTNAAEYLAEFETLCKEDAGSLWGVSFCGPILFVDPATRMVVANQADGGGVLEPRLGLFVGELPAEVGIANTATDFGGTRWTMLMWPSLSEDRTRRLRLMAHEAFHRLQPELGLDPFGEMNAHLDTADGRFWIQMEWNALQRALSVEGETRREALADALAFRASRRALFPAAAERETVLEIFEGLAEYSGMRLAGFSDQSVVEAVAAKREHETGLVRSFAYVSGPLYGFLLDRTGVVWRDRVGSETDLGTLLAEALDLSPASTDAALVRAESYGGAALLAAERERERERREQLAVWRASLIDGPVLIVDLTAVSSGTFDPGRVFPFDEIRTVYTFRELIGAWGVLTVTDAPILEDDSSERAQVSLHGAASDRLAGQGWRLELDDGWEIVAAERPGDFIVREK